MSTPSFEGLGVSKIVTETLAKRGIIAPFPIQALVMKDAMANIDVLAKSRTGSGKTLGFAIPIVERFKQSDAKPSALVLVPTRELANQVSEECSDIARAKGLKVAAVYGGVSINAQANAAKAAHLLVATPGRLLDLIQRKMVSLKNVKILILDEADRMLDMGFQPQVDRIVDHLPKERQTMFFSATLDGEVGRLAHAYTNAARRHEVESPRETVEEADHTFVSVTAENKVDELLKILTSERGLALIFVRTKRGADRLVHKLASKNLRAVAMHGDMSQAARERALARFESGKADVLVATDVAARGLDLDHITHVVNFDPPDDDKGYVHRVGRTARAGRSGSGITLVMPDQRGDVSRMAARLQLHTEFESTGMKIAEPRKVYSAPRGRNSLLGRRPRRKF